MDDVAARIEAVADYRFGDERRHEAVIGRLASENGWSRSFAARAVAEYLRFMALLTQSEAPLSPSDPIDTVWHLHLLHTREYRENFCGRVVGRFVDHHPGTGLPGEAEKHAAQYAATLAAYRARFGTPPPDLWPEEPFGGRFVRVDLRRFRIVPRLWRLLFRRP